MNLNNQVLYTYDYFNNKLNQIGCFEYDEKGRTIANRSYEQYDWNHYFKFKANPPILFDFFGSIIG